MGLLRRVDRLLRPPGHVAHGNPDQQRHLTRWWRWYGLGALVLTVLTVVLALAGTTGPTFLGPAAMLLGLYALWGWRVTHPPG